MTTFQEWRDQFHTTHNTGIPDGHLEAEQARARRVIDQNSLGCGSEDYVMDDEPWRLEGDGDVTMWPKVVLPLT